MVTSVRGRELDAVRRRRAELKESLNGLEAALAASGSDLSVIWGERVHDRVALLQRDFDEHIAVTEGPDGLHAAILAGDLRLANAVEALTGDHAVIADEIEALLEETEPPVTPAQVDVVREQGLRLLARIARHRQKGADLVYEAYDTDLGGGD